MTAQAKTKAKPKPYNPPWLSLLVKIANSWDDFDRSFEANQLDKQVHFGIVGTLMLGKPLSPKQQAAFLESIRRRVPFKSDFQFTGTIALSRKQREYARNSGIAQSLKDKFDEPVSGQRDIDKCDLEQLFSTDSPRIIHESPTIAPISFDFSNLNNLLASYTELQSGTRHYAEVSTVNEPVQTGGVPASPPHQTGTTSPDGFLVLKSATPHGIRGNADSDQLEEERPHLGYLWEWQRREAEAREDARLRAEIERRADEEVARYELADSPVFDAPALKVGLWHDTGKSLTGELTLDGQSYFLKFGSINQLGHNWIDLHGYADHERLWYAQHRGMPEMADLYALWEAQPKTLPESWQLAISPVFQWKLRNYIQFSRVFVRAYFDGSTPQSLRLVHGNHRIEIPLKVNSSKAAKAPHYVQRASTARIVP